MKSAAKARLKEFLEKTPIGGQFTFSMPGNQLQAEAHVQNMRVYLSRVKKKYKVAKKPFNEFKITIIKVEEMPYVLTENGENKSVPGIRITIGREKPKNFDALFSDIAL